MNEHSGTSSPYLASQVLRIYSAIRCGGKTLHGLQRYDKADQTLIDAALPGMKPTVLVTSPAPGEFGLRFSSFSKLCRVTSWPTIFKPLHCSTAKMLLFQVSQQFTYPSVIYDLKGMGK